MCFKNYLKAHFINFFIGDFFPIGLFFDRFKGIVSAWEVFCQHPLFGAGLGGVGPYLWGQWFNQETPIGSLCLAEIELFDPTNVLTEVLASLGVFGFLAIVSTWTVFFRWFMLCLKDKTRTLEERKDIFALLISCIVMLICLQFNQGIFRCYVWVHTGICVGHLLPVRILNPGQSS